MIKPIAIYLPQFHTIPENDKAWGEGFTEWTNVKKAKPHFEGHYQPHVPHEDVGYYDLSDPEVMVRQAAIAKEYGIYGFAFYHYWFNGKRLLETPLDNMLKTGKPDFPFLYIWANENWTKQWDGLYNDIIIKQDYSHDDDLEHIRFLCDHVFSDKRYITIDDKPVFLVYRPELLPDIKETVRIWREEVKKSGFKDLYLVRVENFVANLNPATIDFDAAMEFGPDFRCLGNYEEVMEDNQLIYKNANFKEIITRMIDKNYDYKAFRCVFPSWDNSARKKKSITIITQNSPELFAYFFNQLLFYTEQNLGKEEQLIFINAWNEWGEGCHIEPDQKSGYSYLNGIKQSVLRQPILAPYDYFEYIEKFRRKLVKQNTSLLLDYDKYKNAYLSKYYQVGKLIYKPIKRIKKLFI